MTRRKAQEHIGAWRGLGRGGPPVCGGPGHISNVILMRVADSDMLMRLEAQEHIRGWRALGGGNPPVCGRPGHISNIVVTRKYRKEHFGLHHVERVAQAKVHAHAKRCQRLSHIDDSLKFSSCTGTHVPDRGRLQCKAVCCCWPRQDNHRTTQACQKKQKKYLQQGPARTLAERCTHN